MDPTLPVVTVDGQDFVKFCSRGRFGNSCIGINVDPETGDVTLVDEEKTQIPLPSEMFWKMIADGWESRHITHLGDGLYRIHGCNEGYILATAEEIDAMFADAESGFDQAFAMASAR